MLKAFFIGSGKLAVNLAHAFVNADIQISGVYSKTLLHANKFASQFQTTCFESLQTIPKNCDIYFLAVNDSVIGTLSDQLKVKGIVVHCSGMISIGSLSAQAHKGVFWPIQSFSSERYADFRNIPICIEAFDEEDKRIIEAIADRISNNVIFVSEKERQNLHLAAVFVNNFSNHLFTLASNYLQKNKLNFDLLKPLILETVDKIQSIEPALAQTGPACRHDFNTLVIHEALLKDQPKILEIYRLLSSSIIEQTG